MSWPENPQTPLDIPLVSPDQRLVDTLEVPAPGTGEQLCNFVRMSHEELEAITLGDEQKEKLLGQLLLMLAYRSANAAVPEDLKRVRYAYEGVIYE